MAKPIIATARKHAIRRRVMKRWLRTHGIVITDYALYNESALRKPIRSKL